MLIGSFIKRPNAVPWPKIEVLTINNIVVISKSILPSDSGSKFRAINPKTNKAEMILIIFATARYPEPFAKENIICD